MRWEWNHAQMPAPFEAYILWPGPSHFFDFIFTMSLPLLSLEIDNSTLSQSPQLPGKHVMYLLCVSPFQYNALFEIKALLKYNFP